MSWKNCLREVAEGLALTSSDQQLSRAWYLHSERSLVRVSSRNFCLEGGGELSNEREGREVYIFAFLHDVENDVKF